MTDVLLDTHVLYRWRVQSAKLDKKHARILTDLDRRGVPVSISAITLFELAQLATTGRIAVSAPVSVLLRDLESHPLVNVVPIDAAIAAEASELGHFHGDPADRIIVATAICHGLTLLTQDARIIDWGRVRLA